MPVTTTFAENLIDQPTGHQALNELLAEARKATGTSWQVKVVRWRTGWWRWGKDQAEYQLVCPAPGFPSWQAINMSISSGLAIWYPAEIVCAYLWGVIGQADSQARE